MVAWVLVGVLAVVVAVLLWQVRRTASGATSSAATRGGVGGPPIGGGPTRRGGLPDATDLRELPDDSWPDVGPALADPAPFDRAPFDPAVAGAGPAGVLRDGTPGPTDRKDRPESRSSPSDPVAVPAGAAHDGMLGEGQETGGSFPESGRLRAATVARLCAHRRRRLWSELGGSLSAEVTSEEAPDLAGSFGELVSALRTELEAVREEVGTPGSIEVLTPGCVDDAQAALGCLLGAELVRSLANVADHLAIELKGEAGRVTIGLRASGCRRLPESLAELAGDLSAGDVDLRWEAGPAVGLPPGVNRVCPEQPGLGTPASDGPPLSKEGTPESSFESAAESTAEEQATQTPMAPRTKEVTTPRVATPIVERPPDELWICGVVASASLRPAASEPLHPTTTGPAKSEDA